MKQARLKQARLKQARLQQARLQQAPAPSERYSRRQSSPNASRMV
ncbi:hypothetical protein ACW7G0_05340 [Lysobacter sp. A286]